MGGASDSSEKGFDTVEGMEGFIRETEERIERERLPLSVRRLLMYLCCRCALAEKRWELGETTGWANEGERGSVGYERVRTSLARANPVAYCEERAMQYAREGRLEEGWAWAQSGVAYQRILESGNLYATSQMAELQCGG